MAIELHHLNTHGMMEQAGKVLDGVVRLKERIAELEKENESLKYSVADLETDLAMATRWRKVSEEFPEDGETVIVLLGRTPKTRGFFLTSRYVAGGWTYGEDPQGCKPTHWFRIPKAPEVK